MKKSHMLRTVLLSTVFALLTIVLMIPVASAHTAAPALRNLPVLNLPGSIVTYEFGPGEIMISYDASASDAGGNPLPISCTPPSGSFFNLGTTTVTCSASDSAGTTTGSFQVVLKSQTS